MNYREKSAIENRRKRHIKLVVFLVLAVLLTILVIFSCFVPPATWKYRVAQPKTTKRKDGECRLHFLDVGQGDCILVELPDGKTMLVDGGDSSSTHTRYILRYIYSLGIETLDYLVATHSDADHVGGLSEIVDIMGAKTVYLPLVEYSAGIAYEEFAAAVQAKGYKTEISQRGISLSVQEGNYPYTLCFLSPHRADNPAGEYQKAKEDATSTAINDTSAVILLDYFGSTALLCGDITSDVEETLVKEAAVGLLSFGDETFTLESTEILKVAHHGSSNSSSTEFLNALGVKDAIISVGEENLYGHPTQQTLDNLALIEANIWRTDIDSTIVATLKKDGTYEITSGK